MSDWKGQQTSGRLPQPAYPYTVAKAFNWGLKHFAVLSGVALLALWEKDQWDQHSWWSQLTCFSASMCHVSKVISWQDSWSFLQCLTAGKRRDDSQITEMPSGSRYYESWQAYAYPRVCKPEQHCPKEGSAPVEDQRAAFGSFSAIICLFAFAASFAMRCWMALISPLQSITPQLYSGE